MDEILVLETDSSDVSIEEIEAPKREISPLIDIDVDNLVLNVKNKTHKTLLAKEFIQNSPDVVETDNPSHWTTDMIKFYNDDWGGEDEFTVEKVQEKMDKNPLLWKIGRRPAFNKKRRFSKCWNCLNLGHFTDECPEPAQIPKCHMCGEPGHSDMSCPNSICLNCGNQMNTYVTWCYNCANETKTKCSRCFVYGHHFINCSDHWRRFHSTIGNDKINIPDSNCYKSNNELWCSNCARKGHHQIFCRSPKQLLAFSDTLPFVASYQNSFKNIKFDRRGGMPHEKFFKKKKWKNYNRNKNDSNLHKVNDSKKKKWKQNKKERGKLILKN